MMTTIDLKGWWCVVDDGDDTIVQTVGGMAPYGGTPAAMLQNPTTRECAIVTYLQSYAWFAPEDRAAAEAYAAKIMADYNAAPEYEDDETDEAA